MRIDTIKLTNFKGFEDFELDLHPNCTVLVGTNGSGKTSVLDGLRVALGAWFLGFPDVAPVSIDADDVHLRRIEHDAGVIALEPSYPARIEAQGAHDDQQLTWARELRSRRGKTTYGEAAELRAQAESAQEAVSAGSDIDLPTLAYYGTDRLWRYEGALQDMTLKSRLQGYENSLESGSNHKLLLAWMRTRGFAWLEARAGLALEALKRSGPDPLMRAVSIPVIECMAKLLDANSSGMDFTYNILTEDMVFSFGAEDWMRLSCLSDGYRNTIAMVADIAWRAICLNPNHSTSAAREASGVVLIDEVALHLHPGWQMKVLPALRAAFPNIQFVVTTHSPQVLTSVEPECIRFLQQGKKPLTPNVSKGLDVNTVLRDLMGVPTRPPEIQSRIDELSDAIDEGATAEVERRLDELARLLGEDDPTVTGLRWELRLAAGE